MAKAISIPVSSGGALRDYISLTKPRLSLFVLFTCAVGIWFAPGEIDFMRMLGTLCLTALLVGSANAFNCYLERDTDALMQRTRTRALPDGRLEPRPAFIFACVTGMISFGGLFFVANSLTAFAGLLALFTYVCCYTPMKRKTTLALYVGAIPGAMPPLMGWTAVQPQLDPGALWLFGLMFFWQIPHFLAISLYLKKDYDRARLKVFSNVYGERLTIVAALISSIVLLLVSLVPVSIGLTTSEYGFVAASVGGLLVLVAAFGLSERKSQGWARLLFFSTLFYLFCIFAGLLIGKTG
ncbi:MAG: heme o synthase [Myxococcota bacterium]|jgi:protoheme IX farnesyltransferase|nr:heme o synthase [Myxococcota bacterium]